MNKRPHLFSNLVTFAFFVLILSAGTAIASGDDGNVFVSPDKTSEWRVVGPNGGDVRVVAIDPNDKNRLYISTLDGQIHTSGDGGQTWRLLTNLEEPRLILDQLFVDSRFSNILYASGNRGPKAGGFFKSKDGGLTWKESKDLKKEAIHAMVQSKVDPNVLFVGAKTGAWRSKDSGDNWEKIESTTMPLDINSMAIDPNSNDVIYAGTTWRPYKSEDAGKSWRLIKNGIIDDSDVFAIDIDVRDKHHIIASACSGIYESINGGDLWKKVQGIPSQSRRTRAIVQHPSVAGTVYAGTTEGFWMKSDATKGWILTTSRNIEINSIAVHPDAPDRVFIATNNYGVMVSNDGGRNFVQTNDHFTSRLTYTVNADESRPNRLYAMTQNTASSGGFFFSSNDSGTTWKQGNGLDINQISAFTLLQNRVNSDQLFLGTNHGIFSSIDRGLNWKAIVAPPPAKKAAVKAKKMTAAQKKAAAAAEAKAKAAAALLPKMEPTLQSGIRVLIHTEDEKNGIIAGTTEGLYRTYDIAKGWEKLSLGDGVDQNITAVYASPLLPGTLIVGTARSGVLMSSDDGQTWTQTDATPIGVPVSSIMTDPKRPNYIYIGTVQSLYISRDGGRNWARSGGNLPLGNYTSILIDPENTDELFVSSALENDGGIFYSNDAGKKWKRLDTKDMKLPSRRVWSMIFDPNDTSRIYAGSHSSGVYIIERKPKMAIVSDTGQ